MPAKSKKRALVSIAALHVTVQVTHGYSHVVEGIQNTPLQLVFILPVITIAPLFAVYIAWEINLRKGAALFALSMLAAFLFGYSLHFVIDSPDFHSNVIGEYASVFFYSALNLAILEFVGFVFGAYIWLVPHNDA
jgi:hypothetical protein